VVGTNELAQASVGLAAPPGVPTTQFGPWQKGGGQVARHGQAVGKVEPWLVSLLLDVPMRWISQHHS